jgi:hypothetical protein
MISDTSFQNLTKTQGFINTVSRTDDFILTNVSFSTFNTSMFTIELTDVSGSNLNFMSKYAYLLILIGMFNETIFDRMAFSLDRSALSLS